MICNKCKHDYKLECFRERKNRKGFLYRVKVCIYCERIQKKNAEKNRYENFTSEQIKSHRERSKLSSKKNNYVKWRNIWQKDKEKTNITYKLKRRISSLIRYKLKNKKSTNCILSYSIEELKIHLESKFEPWMNWDNWGIYDVNAWDDKDQSTWTWQIDHIIPQSKFTYASIDDENFIKCWSLNNLRPLSSKENILKGSK